MYVLKLTYIDSKILQESVKYFVSIVAKDFKYYLKIFLSMCRVCIFKLPR